MAWDTGTPQCAYCGQWLGDPGARLEIEVDEAAVIEAEQREQQVTQRKEVTIRHASLGMLLGANAGAVAMFVSQAPISKVLLWGMAIGAVIGVAYWLLADLFEPSAGDVAGGTQVGGVRVVTEFHMAAMLFVMGAMLRALLGNLHAGLVFPLLGILAGTLAVAQFHGGLIALVSLVAAVTGGVLGGLFAYLLFSMSDEKQQSNKPEEEVP